MITLEHVSKTYAAGVPALNDVSLEIEDGEFVFVVGDSGSGKSTLIKLLLKELEPTEGSITIAGKKLGKIRRKQIPKFRRNIGVVFQDFRLLKDRNVYDNVAFAQKVVGEPNSHIKKKVPLMLSMVGLAAKYRSFPKQLSGGEQQRVAIARALINEPSILLADEPTGALDSDTSVQVMDLLREVAKDRLVVMVTHNPELAEQYATRIVNLKDGKIRSDTDEYIVEEENLAPPEHKNMGKSSMSFLTALSLSFNNLRTKKARTLLTSFAGSIGIIGIALILALSNGVNAYIRSIEEETLSEYPLQIQSTGFDLTSMMVGMNGDSGSSDDKKSGKGR